MTDKQFEEIKKDLNFYSEGGADNLCTMTETTLRALLDKVSKTIVAEHFEAYGQCRDSRRIASLEAQIEKMKCCHNCKNCAYAGFEIICRTYDCINHSRWEIKEK